MECRRQQEGLGQGETAIRTGVSWAGQSLDASSWAFAQEVPPQNASTSFIVMTASLEKGESHGARNGKIFSEVVRTETEDCYCGRWQGAVQGRSNFREKGLERQVGPQESLSQRAPPAMAATFIPSQVCLKSIFIPASPLRLQTPKQAQTLPVSEPSKVLVKSADLRASWQTFQSRVASAGGPGIKNLPFEQNSPRRWSWKPGRQVTQLLPCEWDHWKQINTSPSGEGQWTEPTGRRWREKLFVSWYCSPCRKQPWET